MIKHYSNKTINRQIKIRAKLKKVSCRPRLTVYRSEKHIYCQVIDDQQGKTLAAANEKELGKSVKKTKIDKAFALGEMIAGKAIKKKIQEVYFDRGKYKYHGRIKALVEGARKGGLIF